MTSTLICQITDTFDRNAQLKLRSAYVKHTKAYGLDHDAVEIAPSSATLDIGVTVNELFTNTERPDRLILAVNCAPPDKEEGTKDNARNDFFLADLGDGDIIGGTCNGYEMSYVKNQISRLFRLATTNSKNSQYRSLQILPENIVRFSLPGERDRLIKEGALVEIPHIGDIVRDIPNITHAIEVDNFKNVKLVLSDTDKALLARTPEVVFSFGNESVEFAPAAAPAKEGYEGLVAPTMFAAPVGTNVLALRSSSLLAGGGNVPIIATIRPRPAETQPAYTPPGIGHRVFLAPRLNAA